MVREDARGIPTAKIGKLLRQSENQDFLVVLNCKEVGWGLSWSLE